MKTMARIVLVLALFLLLFRYPVEAEAEIEFIDTSFENASPLWWEVGDEGVINVHLLYDHERSSINRAAGHFHFQIFLLPPVPVHRKASDQVGAR